MFCPTGTFNNESFVNVCRHALDSSISPVSFFKPRPLLELSYSSLTLPEIWPSGHL